MSLKIAIFHNLPPGGAKRTVFEEVKYLSENHIVDLYNFKLSNESVWDLRKLVKINYLYEFKLKSNFPPIIRRLYQDFKNFVVLKNVHKTIANDINKRNYDVALIHADKFTQAPFILRYLKIPSLYFCQEYLRMVYEDQFKFDKDVNIFKILYEQGTRVIRKKVDRDNARSADVILANSDFTRNNIEKAYGIKVKTCHLGVDVSVFRKISQKRGRYILHIGQKDKASGYEFISDVLRKIGKESIKIKNLGSFRGKLIVTNDRILAKEYSQAVATICTSYNEPFGLAAIESMACETPVLAVNEGGFRETVVDGVTGYSLERNPQLFAEKINFLINNPQVLEKMGRAGRKHVSVNFTWKKHNKIVEQALNKLVS